VKCNRVDCVCAECGVTYRKRADRVLTPDYCALSCRKSAARKRILARQRQCAECGSLYVPRQYQLKVGQGRFCSTSCSVIAFSKTDARKARDAKSGKSYRENLAAGKFTRALGEKNPLWTGGQKAATRRQVESGYSKRYSKAYRAANPHKVREWTQRRAVGYTGRLPRGTIPRLYALQRGKCAICKNVLPPNYHVDHVIPIKLGGKHEPLNLQLLCPPCNVRKWAHHPVEFAQRNGRLL